MGYGGKGASAYTFLRNRTNRNEDFDRSHTAVLVLMKLFVNQSVR